MKDNKTNKMKRFLSIFLSLLMVLSLLPAYPVSAGNSAGDSITIVACSDFQNPNGNDAGKTAVRSMLSSMSKDGITSADGFFCCGDYNYNMGGTAEGVNALKEAVSDVVTENMVFVQGNHDTVAIGTNGLSKSGNNDPASGDYGVFVINEDDYMWYNSDEGTIKKTAQKLIDYLNVKLQAEYDKPIFVLSHLPLHYSMRTYNDGDGRYANYIFDVLNEAGAKGLNITYMYGHDHSNGWDDYLGGAAVYLPKGDKINIAQASQTQYKEETLNFTYMNPGYTGYYEVNNTGAEGTLTMSALTITDDEVQVKRYSEKGVYNLKSSGVSNEYKSETSKVAYRPNTTVYESPKTIELTSVTDSTPIDNLIEVSTSGTKYTRITDVSQLKDGGKYLLVYNASPDYIMLPKEVTKANSSGSERVGFDLESTSDFGDDVVYGNYDAYGWTLNSSGEGWLLGNGGKYVKFTDMSSSSKGIAATLETEGDVFTIEGDADAFTFTSGSYNFNYNSRGLINGYEDSPAEFYIYEINVPEEGNCYIRITDESQLKDDGRYLLVYNASTDYIMLPEVVTKASSSGSERVGFDIESTTDFGEDIVYGDYDAKGWTLTKGEDGWLVGNNGKYVKFTDTSSQGITATLETEGDVFTIGGDADAFTFTSGSYNFNYNSSRGLINGYEGSPANFYIYEINNAYTRITNAGQLTEKGSYLLVYNASTDYIMLPKVVTKASSSGSERVGFDVESTTDFGEDTVRGSFASKEWKLTKSGSGWLLGTGEKYVKFTDTTSQGITATLETEGDVFTIEGDADAFTFTSGSYNFNYNSSRNLINGYEGSPAEFYIYGRDFEEKDDREVPDYTVPEGLSVQKGTALKDIVLPQGFTFEEALDTVLDTAGTATCHLTYTPEDTDRYLEVRNIPVTIQVIDVYADLAGQGVIWRFEQADGENQWNLLNVSAGKYLGHDTAESTYIALNEEPEACTITLNTDGTWLITYNGTKAHLAVGSGNKYSLGESSFKTVFFEKKREGNAFVLEKTTVLEDGKEYVIAMANRSNNAGTATASLLYALTDQVDPNDGDARILSYALSIQGDKIGAVSDADDIGVFGKTTITLEKPKADETPADAEVSVLYAEEGEYQAVTSWSPAGAFEQGKAYTAVVTITAGNGFTFADSSIPKQILLTDGTSLAVSEGEAELSADKKILKVTVAFAALTGVSEIEIPDTFENGSISVSDTAVAAGETVTVTVTPEEGYELKELIVQAGNETIPCVKVSDSVWTFVMPEGNVTLSARFGSIAYAIEISEMSHGSIPEALNEAGENELVTLKVIPDRGYALKSVTVKGKDSNEAVELTETEDGYTFTMPAEAVTVKAVFERLTYNAATKWCPHGSLELSQTEAGYMVNIFVTVTPDRGYALKKLTVLADGQEVEAQKVDDSFYVFSMPDADVTVSGEFVEESEINQRPNLPSKNEDDDKSNTQIQQLTAPQITSVASTVKGVNVKWSAVSGAAGYEVYRTVGGTKTKVADVTTNSYRDTAPKAGKSNSYSVVAVAGANAENSAESAQKAVSIPATVKNLKVKQSGKNLVVTFKKVKGATNYIVYRSTKKASGYKKVAAIKANKKLSYTDKKAKKGKPYYYKVITRKGKTYSPNSKIVKKKVK